MKKLFLAFAVLAIALSSCTQRLTDFTVISTKNYPISTKGTEGLAKGNMRVTGEDTKSMILFIPLGTPIYESETAARNAGAANHNDSNTINDSGNNNSNTLLFFHEVKDGETLASIAKQYGVSMGNIISWNKLNSNVITEGSKLKIYISE